MIQIRKSKYLIKTLIPPLLVFTLTVCVRLIVLYAFTVNQADLSAYKPYVFPDSINFVEYSNNLANAGEYIDSAGRMAWRTPAYSLFLSAMIKLSGNNVFLWRFLNIFIAGISSLLAFSIARRLWGAISGLVAGAFFAFYPFMAFMDTLILADTLGVFACLLAVRLLLEAVMSGKGMWAGFCGLSCAFAVMVKASFGGLAVLFAIYLFICWWGRLRYRAIMLPLLLLLSFGIGMLPWTVRNYIALKAFIPLSTMGGFTLWECTGPGADGGANHGKVKFPDEWTVKMNFLASGERFSASGESNEVLADKVISKAAWSHIKENPQETLSLSLNKFLRTWSPVPNWSGASGWKYATAMAVFYLPVMGLALVGIFTMRKSWKEVYLLLLPAVYFAAVHTVFMGSIRYRLPAVAVLSVLAAGVIFNIFIKSHPVKNEKSLA